MMTFITGAAENQSGTIHWRTYHAGWSSNNATNDKIGIMTRHTNNILHSHATIHTSATHCSQLLLLWRMMNDEKYKVIQPLTIGLWFNQTAFVFYLVNMKSTAAVYHTDRITLSRYATEREQTDSMNKNWLLTIKFSKHLLIRCNY